MYVFRVNILCITGILIPSYGNITETYVYDEATRIQFVHYLLSKCPLCALYIQSVRILRV